MKPSTCIAARNALASLETISQTVPEANGSQFRRENAQAALDFHQRSQGCGITPLEGSSELAKYAKAWGRSPGKR